MIKYSLHCEFMDQEILRVFLEEFDDMIGILDKEVKKYPSKNILVNEIFRVFHTLKGNSATIEYTRLHKLTNFYCEYFRPKQKETSLSEKEFKALKSCLATLKLFRQRIENGKKGKTIKIARLMRVLN